MVRNKTKSKHDMSPLNVVLKSLLSEVTVENMADMEANRCYQVEALQEYHNSIQRKF